MIAHVAWPSLADASHFATRAQRPLWLFAFAIMPLILFF